MVKYCPRCKIKNHDLLQTCFNCGTFLGKGRVDKLETREGAHQVAKDFNIEEFDDVTDQNVLPAAGTKIIKDKGLALVTLYGVSRTDINDLMERHNIEFQFAEMPGLFKSDDAMTEEQERHQMLEQQQDGKSSIVAGGSGGSYYYYGDPGMSGYCCYYACTPSRRYRSYHSTRSGSCCAGSGDCDCNESSSDSDDLGGIIIILVLVVLVALVIIFAPTIVIGAAIVIEGILALFIFFFNILTLGIFRKKLTRTRVRILAAEQQQLDLFFDDLLQYGGLPKMHGYWSGGFTLIRYGAQFFMTGLILIVLVFIIPGSSRSIYFIPGGIILISIAAFIYGNYAINQKITEIRQNYTGSITTNQ